MEAVNDNDDHQPTSDDAEGGEGGTRRRCQGRAIYHLYVIIVVKGLTV